MPPTPTPDDPRTLWRRVVLLKRLTPRWLGGVISFLVDSLAPVFRRYLDKDLPEYRQFRLSMDGVNADLYRDRVKAALDLLATYAPVYLRWLRVRFNSLLVHQVFQVARMRSVTAPNFPTRTLILQPRTVWRASSEQLALYLVGAATRWRIGRAFRRIPAMDRRASRRALVEMIACARILPNADALVETWNGQLREFDRRFPGAAA